MTQFKQCLIVLLCTLFFGCATNDPITANKIALAERLVEVQYNSEKFQPQINHLLTEFQGHIETKYLEHMSFMPNVKNDAKLLKFAIADLVKQTLSADNMNKIMVDYYLCYCLCCCLYCLCYF